MHPPRVVAATPVTAMDDPYLFSRMRLAESLHREFPQDGELVDTLISLPRELFVEPASRFRAYEDEALPIRFGQSISQPYTVLFMTRLLRPKAGLRVLEIGTGSGYQTALLARLKMEVFSLEILEPLYREAESRLRALNLVSGVHLRHGDGRLGWPEMSPFQRVLVTAAPAERVPPALRDQLAEGGVLVAPVGPQGGAQHLSLEEIIHGRFKKVLSIPVRFVPLV